MSQQPKPTTTGRHRVGGSAYVAILVVLVCASCASVPAPREASVLISIETEGTPTAIDPRLFGSNLPAWLGPDLLANADFRRTVIDSGVSVLRVPGGVWSNSYDWLACQEGDERSCYWPWAARPSDFLTFLRATATQPMWTVSPNETALHAAALVAFFNGDVADERPIGVDRRGQDWKSVGHWARLRQASGSPEPFPITLWEFGNEVYGAMPSVGPTCAAWGWADVWTCDGTEYVRGIGQGADRHEGYLEFRAAMQAVDPTIMLGAVGVPEPQSWDRWGEKVIAAAGSVMDFYVIHQYALFESPADPRAILRLPQATWPQMIANLHAMFDQYAGGRRVPIAVTEYNLFAVEEQDSGQWMTRAVNALFLADTLGQMAQSGVVMANQWNAANGMAGNGTDYGMIRTDLSGLYPQYYIFPFWRRVGEQLLPVRSSLSTQDMVSVYAGRTRRGTYTLLAINKTARPIQAQVTLEGPGRSFDLRVDTLRADSLEATTVYVNERPSPRSDWFAVPLTTAAGLRDRFEQRLAPFSITLVEVTPTS